MIAPIAHRQHPPRAVIVMAWAAIGLGLGLGLAGCAGSVSDIGGNLTEAFADPAKYEYYDCGQLESERKSLTSRIEDLQRLMAKADTGVAGPVVAELAYRNDYIAYRGQMKFADEAWRRNKCKDAPPPAPGVAAAAATPVVTTGKGGHSQTRSGNAVY